MTSLLLLALLFAQTLAPTDDLRNARELAAKGRHTEAANLAASAAAEFERTYGADHRHVAEALGVEGTAYVAANEVTRAADLLRRAVSIWEKLHEPEDRTLGEILTQLAYCGLRTGDYASARLTGQRAVAVLEHCGDNCERSLGQALRIHGSILNEMGDVAGAGAANRRAAAVLEKTSGPDSEALGDLFITMGNAAHDAGDQAQARALHERAASIYERRLGPHDTRFGGALDALGQDLLAMGDIAGARRSIERALDIQREALGPRSPWVGNLIQGLARVANAEGDYERARVLYEQNLDIWREQLGETHPYTVVSTGNLADVMAHLRDRDSALTLARKAAKLRREHIQATVRTVEERQALRYAAVRMTSLDTALTLAVDRRATSGQVREVWDTLIRTRALVFDEMASRRFAVHQSADPRLAALAANVAAARSNLARAAMQGKGSQTQAAYDSHMDAARARVQQAEQAIALVSASSRQRLARERAGFAEVRAALPAGSALVAFVRYSRRDYSRTGDVQTPSYAAFCQRPGASEPEVADLGPAAPIEAAVRAWRGEMDRERLSAGRSVRQNLERCRVASTRLRRLLWDPVARLARSADRVVLVPDGALQFVNFLALMLDDGRYLAEVGPLLELRETERDLVGKSTWLPTVRGRLLAAGGPAFPRPPAPAGTGCSGNLQFAPLPGSAAEVRGLSAIWKQSGGDSDVLTGPAATESAVKARSSSAQVVHLATHGFYLPACAASRTPGLDNPLLRSGLALASAKNDQDDGILTAEEASSLDLSGTEWVVLSGCETGLGELESNEGVLGLRRAFHQAGARAVITSLWSVEDNETRKWMESVYRRHFLQGASTAAAIREASRSAISRRKAQGRSTHPFHWAGFVATGD